MRSANMQSLTEDLKRRWPGVVVYGIGDGGHKLRSSDHNEDDTRGSKAAQSDGDTTPEHRAIDIMLGGSFNANEANGLVTRMVNDAATKRRLYYVIHKGKIWSRSTNWVGVPYDGDSHSDHVHISGFAADDENAAPWPVVMASTGSSPMIRLRREWPSYMRAGHYFGLKSGPNESHGGFNANERIDVRSIQGRLGAIGFNPGSSDGDFGPRTKAAVEAWQAKLYAKQTTRYGEVWKDDWVRLFTY